MPNRAGTEDAAHPGTQPFYSWDATKGSTPQKDIAALELMARTIKQPGKIQDSGLFLGVDLHSGRVRACSKNCKAYLLMGEQEVLGHPLGSLFKCKASELASILEKVDSKAFSNCMTLLSRDMEVDVTWSRAGGEWLLVEVEERISTMEVAQAAEAAKAAETRAMSKQTEQELHAWIVLELQHILTGFDRVKVYKFFAGHHGEVVSEALLPGAQLESCLHRSYPATDVPQRARDLFLINPIRYISDTAAEQVEVACLPGFEASGISLVSCGLRAVHPCHLEYLQNMHVRASFTCAIVVQKKLWGLIACHSSKPTTLPRCVRSDCWHVAQVYCARLSTLLGEQKVERVEQLERVKMTLQAELRPADGKNTTTSQIQDSLRTFAKVVDCQGFAFVTTAHTSTTGMVPDDESIRRLEKVLNTSAKPGVFDANSLAPLFGESLRTDAQDKLRDVGGVLAVRCVRGCTLMWFRQQETRKVQWGGKDVAHTDPGVFRPRQSFSDWTEQVEGTCKPWTEEDEHDAVEVGMALDRRWFHDTSIERLSTSPDGRVLEWNAPLAKLVCMSADKAGGKDLSSLCFACEKQDVEDMLARFRSDEQGQWTAHLNIFTQKTGGQDFNVWRRDNTVSKEVFVYEITGSHAVMEDPLLQRREEIARPESVYHVPQDVGMMDEMPMPLWIMDCDAASCTYLWANKAALAVFGYTLTEFMCLDLNTEYLDARAMSLWHGKVQQQQQRLHCRQTFYGKTTVALDLVINPLRVATAHGVKVLCLVVGKPATNETENLRSNELLQASKVMMMLFTPSGDLITANIAARVYYSMALVKRELSLEDVFESSCWDSEKERQTAFDKMMAVCGTNIGRTFEIERYKMHPKVGVVHQIQFSSARDPTTGQLAIAVNETDISGLKSVQDDLVAAKMQQERFLAATSHELRTPLHAILALSDNLIRNDAVSESGLKMLKIIQSSGQQLASLVNDILDAAAIHAGALVLKNDVVQLNLLVGTVIDAVNPLAPRTVNMVNAVPEDLPVLQVDCARLQQILINLLGNAVKFTRTGEIRVSAEMQGKGDLVAISVKDTGRGIPEDKLKAIWQAFQQVEPAAQSTGLGLTIVRSLIEAMGGMIEVESVVMQGTKFTIVLPKSPECAVQKVQGAVTRAAEPGLPRSGSSSAETRSGWDNGVLSKQAKLPAGEMSEVELELLREMNATLAKLHAREEELEVLKSARQTTDSSRLDSRDADAAEPNAADGSGAGSRCLYVTEDEIEEGQRRMLEILGLRPVVKSPMQAQKLLCGEPAQPLDLDVVIINGMNLRGYLREKVGWLRNAALNGHSVPVLLLSRDPEVDADEALAGGCTGLVRLPLELGSLQEALIQQRDLKRLYQWSAVLSNRTEHLPETHTIASARRRVGASARAAELAEGEVVHQHAELAVVSLQLEVSVDESAGRSAAQLVQLAGQLLESCTVSIAALAEKHGALLAEARGDTFTLVMGHEHPHREPTHAAALAIATALLHAIGSTYEGPVLRAISRIGVALGPCYEAAIPLRTASTTRQVAFFGLPCMRAAALAATAAPGHLVLDVGVFKALYPHERAEAGAYSYAVDSQAWKAESTHAPPQLISWPGPLPPTMVPAVPAEVASAEERTNFQEFAAVYYRMAHGAKTAQRLLPECFSSVDMQLVSLLSTKIGNLHLALADKSAVSVSTSPSGAVQMAVIPDGEELLAQASVLSVDDSPVNQVVMESILRPLVKNIRLCMDGPEALALIEDGGQLPDIILLDVMLPTSSGLQVCRRLRQHFSPMDLPILLVSGKSSKDSIVQGLEAGANDYIIKPFDSAELISRVACQLKMVANVKAKLKHAFTVDMQHKLLPPLIAQRMCGSEPDDLIDDLEDVSVLCAGIVDYSSLFAAGSREVMNALSSLFAGFDFLCSRNDGWALESSEDCYMMMGGQDAKEADQAGRLVQVGLDMLQHARSIKHPTRPGSLEVSVAIHTGRVTAGVRASKISGGMHRFCVYGEASQVASCIQATATPMTLNVSGRTHKLIRNQFSCVSLGSRAHCGLEAVETFVVQDRSSPWEVAAAEARTKKESAAGRSSLVVSPPAAPPAPVLPVAVVPEPSPERAVPVEPARASSVKEQDDASALELVLGRAKLQHMLPELLAERVDVDCLAEATDQELEELGIDTLAARSRVRRYAKAWVLLFSH